MKNKNKKSKKSSNKNVKPVQTYLSKMLNLDKYNMGGAVGNMVFDASSQALMGLTTNAVSNMIATAMGKSSNPKLFDFTENKNPVMKYGGKVKGKGKKMKYKKGGTVKMPIAEVEDGEAYEKPNGEVGVFKGDKHGQDTDGDGFEGIPVTEEEIPVGTKIFSDSLMNAATGKSFAEDKIAREKRKKKAQDASKERPFDIFLKNLVAQEERKATIQENAQEQIQEAANLLQEGKQLADDIEVMNAKYGGLIKYMNGGMINKYKRGGEVESAVEPKNKSNFKMPVGNINYEFNPLRNKNEELLNNKANIFNTRLGMGNVNAGFDYTIPKTNIGLSGNLNQPILPLFEGTIPTPTGNLEARLSNKDNALSFTTGLETDFINNPRGYLRGNYNPSDNFSASGSVTGQDGNLSGDLSLDYTGKKVSAGANIRGNKEGVEVGGNVNYNITPGTKIGVEGRYAKNEQGNYEPTGKVSLTSDFRRNKKEKPVDFKYGGMVKKYQEGGTLGYPPPGMNPLLLSQFPLLFSRGQPRLSNLDLDTDDARDFSNYFEEGYTHNGMFPYGPYGYAGVMSNGPQALMKRLRRGIFNNPVEPIKVKGLSDDLLNKNNTLPNVQPLDEQTNTSSSTNINKYLDLGKTPSEQDPYFEQMQNLYRSGASIYDRSNLNLDPLPTDVNPVYMDDFPIEQEPDEITKEAVDDPYDVAGSKMFNLATNDIIGQLNNMSDFAPGQDPNDVVKSDAFKLATNNILNQIANQKVNSFLDSDAFKLATNDIAGQVENMFSDDEVEPSSELTESDTTGLNFTMGDLLGLSGTGIAGTAPMLSTIINRAGDTPNINPYQNFGKQGLAEREGLKGLMGRIRDENLRDIGLKSDTQRKIARSGARGINQLRAFGELANAQEQEMLSNINAKYAEQMAGISKNIASAMDVRDKMTMLGREKQDLADRQDRDNFFTQLNKDFGNMGKAMQKIGKDLNVKQLDKDFLGILEQTNKYGIGQRINKDGKFEMYSKATGKTLSTKEARDLILTSRKQGIETRKATQEALAAAKKIANQNNIPVTGMGYQSLLLGNQTGVNTSPINLGGSNFNFQQFANLKK